MIRLIIIALLFSSCSVGIVKWDERRIEKVSVLDSNFETVTKITSYKECEIIKDYLAKAKEMEVDSIGRTHFIDIKTDKSTARWIYNSEKGYFRLLTKARCPCYKIEGYKELNKLILQ